MALSENVKITIMGANGLPKTLMFGKDDLYRTTADLNWNSFCSKITIKQKRYGEAAIANVSFSLISSYGRIGGEQNSVLKNVIELGDRVDITIQGKLDLSAYFGINMTEMKTVVKPTKIFSGYVWNIKTNHLGEVEITCYDLLKYLQNQKCFFSYKKTDTAASIINAAVKNLNLGKGEKDIKLMIDTPLFSQYKVDTTGTQETFFVYDKNFIDLTNWLLNRCLMAGLSVGKGYSTYMLFLVDYDTNMINIGTAEFLGKISAYTVSEKSLITSCELTESIESDVFNSIYAGIDYLSSDEIGGRWWGLATENNSVKQLGSLCHYERFSQSDFYQHNTNLTIDTVKKVIEKMVLIKSKPKVKLTIKAIGNPFLRAGMLVPVKLPDSLVKGLIVSFDATKITAKTTPIVLIDEITHTISGNMFEMEFTSSVLLENFSNWTATTVTEQK